MTTLDEFLSQFSQRRDPVYNDVTRARFEIHELQIDMEQVLNNFQNLDPELIEVEVAEWRDKVEECRELTAPSGLFAP